MFDFIFNIRSLNDGIDERREELFTEWLKERSPDAKPLRVRSMDDYAELVQQNKRRRMTQSTYVRASLMNNVRAHSNGESALLFFTDKIDENSLYLVDEPENSLSTESQKKLAEYIENAARFYNCQFIISSHSPFMLSLKGARVYDMDAFPVRPCTGRTWRIFARCTNFSCSTGMSSRIMNDKLSSKKQILTAYYSF